MISLPKKPLFATEVWRDSYPMLAVTRRGFLCEFDAISPKFDFFCQFLTVCL